MKQQIILSAILTIALLSCGDKEERDLQKPEIQIVSPQNCAELRRGESLKFTAHFADNAELGSYNLEIHHNFDHHSHSTDSDDCTPDAAKTPFNAWIFNQDYAIPAGSRTFDASVEIAIPADIDDGDYHFMVRLTDKSGWQQIAAKSIKVRK